MKQNSDMIVHDVPLSLIDRPAVPDRLTVDLDYIKELASSMAELGLKTPLLLCKREHRYEVVAGDCRFQAAVSLGWATVPAFIDELTGSDVSVLRAIENLQRRDLTIIEEARIYRRLHDDHAMSWDQISKRTSISPGLVKRRYDLLKMPDVLVNAIHQKKIGYAVAEELFRLQELGKIEYYLGFCIDHGATQAVVKDWVKEEQSRERQKLAGTGGGDWGSPMPEQLPIYVSCELCHGPMEIAKTIALRICHDCHSTIKQNM